ncbi:MAG: amino acid ABC transporter substrate-binding protein [Alphaproteobacteria bacterium]|nr:amino acid ABC transporter substrate-binding protein [Alphaproteobacteria bacterium]MBF0371993.1 amino acid ABC transporter substrate-binding protein [Alphaproteobacteria bacterium]
MRAHRLMVLFAAAVLLATRPALADELTVAVTENVVPFSFRDEDGALTGFNVEVGRALCEAMGATCRFEAVPLAQLVDGVAEGRIHFGLGNLLKTPEREKRMAFSQSYWRSTSSYIARRGATPGPDGLPPGSATIAVQAGSRQEKHVGEALARNGLRVLTAHSIGEVLQLVADGTAEVALVPTLTGLGFLRSPAGKDLDFLGEPLSGGNLGGSVHIVVAPGRPDLLTRLNGALDAIQKDGSYHAMTRKYFPFSIY